MAVRLHEDLGDIVHWTSDERQVKTTDEYVFLRVSDLVKPTFHRLSS